MINPEKLNLGKVDLDFSKVYSCIYCIYNNVDDKIYLGVTVGRLSKRFRHHLWELRGNRHSNSHLQRAFNLHGENSFSFGFIEKDINEDILNEREIFYINEFQSTKRELGYNILSGGIRKVHSLETREKLRKTHLEGHASGRLKSVWLGRRHSEETKKRIAYASSLKKGKHPCSEEQKKKISIANKGKVRTQEHKKNISEGRKEKYDKSNNPNVKKVLLFNELGIEIKRFHGTEEAGLYLGYSRAFIADICRGERKSSQGLILKYA